MCVVWRSITCLTSGDISKRHTNVEYDYFEHKKKTSIFMRLFLWTLLITLPCEAFFGRVSLFVCLFVCLFVRFHENVLLCMLLYYSVYAILTEC